MPLVEAERAKMRALADALHAGELRGLHGQADHGRRQHRHRRLRSRHRHGRDRRWPRIAGRGSACTSSPTSTALRSRTCSQRVERRDDVVRDLLEDLHDARDARQRAGRARVAARGRRQGGRRRAMRGRVDERGGDGRVRHRAGSPARDVGLGRRPLLRVVGRRARPWRSRSAGRSSRRFSPAAPRWTSISARAPLARNLPVLLALHRRLESQLSRTRRATRCCRTTTTSRASRPTCSSSRWRATASPCAAAASPSSARRAPSSGASRARTPSTPFISCCTKAPSACRSISCCRRVRLCGARTSRISRPPTAWRKRGRSPRAIRASGRARRAARTSAIPGNRPSSLLLFERLDAATLGKLVALYEHKVYVQGVIWDVNSFDQWGVQLGKRLASELIPAVAGEASPVQRPWRARSPRCGHAETERKRAPAALPPPCRYLAAPISCGLSAEALHRMLARTAVRSPAPCLRACFRCHLDDAAFSSRCLRRRRRFRGVRLGASVIAQAQVPIPVQEQIRLFNSMSPAQQQSLIRELQRSLPPAQREAIIGMLQGGGDGRRRMLSIPTPKRLSATRSRARKRTTNSSTIDEPRLEPGDTIVIRFERQQDDPRALTRTPEEQEQLDAVSRTARGRQSVSSSTAPVSCTCRACRRSRSRASMSTKRRCACKPKRRCDPFTIIVTFLPLEPVGIAALEPFGYDLFERSRRAFAPDNDIPVPADYVIGPGDTVNVQLFGSQNIEHFLPVSREGTINFPEIGPINVSGLTFAQMRDTLNQRVMEQMIGVRASITLGELRSIRVFVLGDVVRPGSYTVSGLSTITNALYASGGVKPIGSLRNIALRRDGATVATLDLYELLLRGDTRGDVRLQPGDAIFVPPIGASVTVDGEVRRPAIYEVRTEESVADLVALAGGLNADANRAAVKLERVVPNRGTTVQDIDLAGGGAQTAVRDGDVLRVPAESRAARELRASGGQRVPAGALPMASGHAAHRPRAGSGARQAVVRLELRADSARDRAERRDRSHFGGSAGRVAAAQWRGERRAAAARHRARVPPRDRPAGDPRAAHRRARSAGCVRTRRCPWCASAGKCGRRASIRSSPACASRDLLRAGGGLSDAAYVTDAELTRYTVVDGEYRETELVTVNLASVLRGDAAANLAIGPYDYLNIKEVSRWRGEESVTIRGEVVFPGSYPIRRGETSVVAARARRRADRSRVPGGQRVHARRDPGAPARAARVARAARRARPCRHLRVGPELPATRSRPASR